METLDHTASFDTQGVPRGGIIVEIQRFLDFFFIFLTCAATLHFLLFSKYSSISPSLVLVLKNKHLKQS
jgi:hypothetical protein